MDEQEKKTIFKFHALCKKRSRQVKVRKCHSQRETPVKDESNHKVESA